MQYRRFGKLDWEISALGFGAMRLPTIDNDEAKIDEPKATEMLRYAIDHGVNYVDTAYPYHEGTGEASVGRALQDGYRDKVKLATKMPCWLIEKPADLDKYLDEQLKRLQTDHIDVYLLHAIWRERWARMQKMKVFEWAERAIADGCIGHLGFSFLPAGCLTPGPGRWTRFRSTLIKWRQPARMRLCSRLVMAWIGMGTDTDGTNVELR